MSRNMGQRYTGRTEESPVEFPRRRAVPCLGFGVTVGAGSCAGAAAAPVAVSLEADPTSGVFTAAMSLPPRTGGEPPVLMDGCVQTPARQKQIWSYVVMAVAYSESAGNT